MIHRNTPTPKFYFLNLSLEEQHLPVNTFHTIIDLSVLSYAPNTNITIKCKCMLSEYYVRLIVWKLYNKGGTCVTFILKI